MISTTHRSRVLHRTQCPLCVKEHRDTARDNLAVYDDGHEYCYGGHGLIKGDPKDFILTDFTYEYLPWRGVDRDTMEIYDVKTKIDAEGKPVSLGFKYPNGVYKVRHLEPDANGRKRFEWVPKGQAEPGLFGRDRFSSGTFKYVTITEGEVDALSLYSVLHAPVVSVQSSSSAARDCSSPDDRAWLNTFERIYLAFDDDEQGRQAVREVARLFDPNKLYYVRFDGKRTRKDANEYLQRGEGEDLKRIWWSSKPYVPFNIINSFSEFRDVLQRPKKLGVPYPWPTLNAVTYGIRTGETVLLTAQEKVGKTELMHFIEHQLLEHTDENVGAFFLEEPAQRHLQALAAISLRSPVHMPEDGTSTDDAAAAIEKLVKADGRLHLYTHFGSDDPMVFLDTVRFLATVRKCRYILVDHISMVASGVSGSSDERKLLDYLSTRLEMMVKELDIALIMVSHVNDFGQTRGSRWLTKVCDLQINATRDMMADDPVERNTIYLSVPISRFPGITGPAGALIFDRSTYRFTERGENDNATSTSFGAKPYSNAA